MNPRRNFLKTSATLSAAAAAGLLAACGGGNDSPSTPQPTQNIVQLALATPDLSILAEAVIAADLVAKLSNTANLTVFAPNDAAFAALLTELGVSKATLLANKPLLTAVLNYHVLGTKVLKADIPLGKAIDPLLEGTGDVFKIDVVGPDVVINDGRNRKAKITATDFLATNGVVHIIDKVILPADKDIVATALASASEFSTLAAALTQANLVSALQAAGPFTVFAPTNAAFDALRLELGTGGVPITVAALLARTDLADILKYHVVSGRVLKADITVGAAVTTLQGRTFSVSAALAIQDGRTRSAPIRTTDILTSNGVIHVIDKVILPPVSAA